MNAGVPQGREIGWCSTTVNDAMRRNDGVLGDMPLVDDAGGATVFLDSRVRIEKV